MMYYKVQSLGKYLIGHKQRVNALHKLILSSYIVHIKNIKPSDQVLLWKLYHLYNSGYYP